MAIRKFRILGAATALASLSVLAPLAAQAADVYRSCSSSGHTLNTSTYYTQTTAQHYWDDSSGYIGGNGTGGKSNINWTLTVSGNTIWTHYSGDIVKNNGSHYTVINKYTTRSANENLYIKGIFDVRYSDPSCTALVDW